MPKFSIIVPVYNCEKDLPKCLDTLVGQTLSDIEIIIVNDGSPDNSQAIIDDYAARYPHLIKAYAQENRGQSAARNFALDKARGEFVFFVDSDDYVDTTVCEKTYAFAKENDLDIVCFNIWIEEEGKAPKFNDRVVFKELDTDIKYVITEASPCTKIIKRSILEDNGLRFVENYIYEDFELIPRLVLYTQKIGYMNEAFYYYIIHEGSTMRQKTYNKKLSSIYFVLESLKAAFENTKYNEVLEYLYIEHLLHLSTLRYLDYAEGVQDIKKIAGIMKSDFPNWRKNKYYQMSDFKVKVFCELAARKQIKLLKLLMNK
ncbi:MAG: glycosyltransferase [Clostridia bacterium]|nr:glycosyltransferase [Clostridia bacterium]